MDRMLTGRTIPVLLVGNLVLLVGFVTLRGASYGDSAFIVVVNLAMVIPTLACFVQARRAGPRRASAMLFGCAMLFQAGGNVIFSTWTQYQVDPPVPSPSDIAYLGFYVSVAVAVVWMARREDGSFPRALWLDGAIGAAGAASALAGGMTLVGAGPKGDSAAVFVSAAYTVADLLLVAMVGGLLVIRGLRGGSTWIWLAGGMAVFCAADVAYAVLVSKGTYDAAGSGLYLLWMTGITSIAISTWSSPGQRRSGTTRSKTMLAIPLLASLTAVVVLATFSFGEHPAVMALAALTLLLAAARTLVTFRQVQHLAGARRQAVTDDLTELGNRRSLFEHGTLRLQIADPDDRIALILIDLDNFKEINDTFGHPAGDELLREIGRRLVAGTGEHDLLVRLGGDEFALLVTLPPTVQGRQIATRILDRITEPFVIDGARVIVDASAGIAERDDDGLGIVDLLRRADVAMYAAKDAHSRVASYDPQLDEANRVRLETSQDLDAAFGDDQFVLHYQPVIDVASRTTLGAEALVRWEHPTRGLLYPDAFLPVVEQSGLMHTVTRLVLRDAVRQLAVWKADGLDIVVAVNLSASDLLDDSLVDRIEALLDEHSLPGRVLKLEITESVLMLDPERARSVLDALRSLGVRIALDDYGTGYCSLAYLRDLPVDELKLDRSFVARVNADPRSSAIVRSTIELAHALGLLVVAEGVEDQATLDTVAGFGCDYAQGYLFSRPVAPATFVETIGHGPVSMRARYSTRPLVAQLVDDAPVESKTRKRPAPARG